MSEPFLIHPQIEIEQLFSHLAIIVSLPVFIFLIIIFIIVNSLGTADLQQIVKAKVSHHYIFQGHFTNITSPTAAECMNIRNIHDEASMVFQS